MTTNVPAGASLETQFKLARAWHAKGTLPRAIAGYRDVLALDPGHCGAALGLGRIMWEQYRLDEALAIYRAALEYNPHESLLHKQLVNLLLVQESLDTVFRHYKLVRKDSKILNLRPGQVLVCTVLKDERPRLPYFLEYYRRKGVRAFFAIDNASSDGTLEYLLDQPDVYVWHSDLAFHHSNFGSAWMEPILRQNGQHHWCLIVDADELFYYPDCESRSIPDLCETLDRAGKRAYNAILLDMYSDKPVQETHYQPGSPFEEACPFFDGQFYHTSYDNSGPYQNQTCYFGGVRQRIFGEAGEYILNKVPLIKYDRDSILAGGQHWSNAPFDQTATESGCLLHFKYFSSFGDYVSQVAGREQSSHWRMQHQEYRRGLDREGGLTFYDPAQSVRLENSDQLVRLGVMKRGGGSPAPEFPPIEAVAEQIRRPMWSVMISVYRRTSSIRQALQSVLAQAPEDMEIEVVCDGPPHPVCSQVEEIVRSVGSDRVSLYRHPNRAGHPEIFNVCVRRARGHWIHILHDDDWVAPGFYSALSAGIRQAPEIGAAFCRHEHVDDEGRFVRRSSLERETPGVIAGWLDRIACVCRLQAASVVVRRESYERLGGYCAQAKSAFDWEMWQRIAVHYPVWFEPRVLAFFRESRSAESAGLVASGGQIADTRAALSVSRTYLPPAAAETLGHRAAEFYAMRALDLARQQMNAGDAGSALANLREAVLCSQSPEVCSKLLGLLGQWRGSGR